MIFFRPRRISLVLRLIATVALAACAGHAAAMGNQPAQKPARVNGHAQPEAEAMLIKTFAEIRNNRLDVALTEVEKVLQGYPNFRLAHLIKGDLLLARTRPITTLGNTNHVPQERLEELRDEARVRLARYQFERPADRVPKYLLQLHPDQKHAIIVDTRQSTLYVFENHDGVPQYVADYYVSLGKNGVGKLKEGDKKTPLGVYHVTDNLPRAKLSDFYGSGAFPINYPNEWDRRQGRDGYGIWLHGSPSDTYSRPPRASDGCVALTNQDLEAIGKNMRIGVTPVIIADGIDWVKPEALDSLRQDLLKSVESWRHDWESLDTGTYLKHYAPGFSSGSQNLAAWSQQKLNVNAAKSWIKVRVERISVFLYPGRDNLAVITFDQDYASSNLSNRMKKRQYWINENGAWRILYEGAA
ncbi:MAG: L,D-transpeptidase family protein [Betaproteobacteria bacterium]|nr:L,D-transpeptidase family protein [Betaproteobacteria bacterium]